MGWYRVVGDEIHVVPNHATNKSRAVIALKAQKRIVDTGTLFLNEGYLMLKGTRQLFGMSRPQLARYRNAILAMTVHGAWIRRVNGEFFEDESASGAPALIFHDMPFNLDRKRFIELVNGNQMTEQSIKGISKYYWNVTKIRQKRNMAKEHERPADDIRPSNVLTEITRARQAVKQPALPKARYGAPEEDVEYDPDLDMEGDEVLKDLTQREEIKSLLIHGAGPSNRQAFRETIKDKWQSTRMSLAVRTIKEHLNTKPGKISESQKNRDINESRFRIEQQPGVMLLTAGCGGAGLDLLMAGGVMLLSPLWSPALAGQCVKRARRMGWVNIVHVYILHAKRSIKVKVAAIQKKKFTKSDALLKPKNKMELE
ncbi:MAG: hypothetical protein Q9164_001368 [Protoblastenia rupestris]